MPAEGTLNGPGEDRRARVRVINEMLFDSRVAAAGRHGVRERDLDDAAPDGVVRCTDGGAVVSGEPEGEVGPELELFAVEKPGGDGVAASELLDEAFGEAFAFVDLQAYDKATAGEARDVVADARVTTAGKEGVKVGRGGVLTRLSP